MAVATEVSFTLSLVLPLEQSENGKVVDPAKLLELAHVPQIKLALISLIIAGDYFVEEG